MEDNNIMNLHKLELYMTNNSFEYNNKSYGDNYDFTKLIINKQIVESIAMLHTNKDLKFDRDLMKNCRGSNMCGVYFEDLIKDICVSANSYIDVIKILQFLVPENIIGSDCYEECNKLTHNYVEYCSHCIIEDKINVARAIYIMFNVDNMKLLRSVFYLTKSVKIAYSIIIESQNFIPLERRNIPTLDIIEYVDKSFYHCYDIIEWYYKKNPHSYTKEKIDEIYKLVLKKDRNQLRRFKSIIENLKKE